MNRLDEIKAWAQEHGIGSITNAALILVDVQATARVQDSEIPLRCVAAPITCAEAFTAGSSLADELIDSGTDLIAVSGLDLLAARTIIGVITKRDAAAIIGLPTQLDDVTWMTMCGEVRDHMHAVRAHVGEPMEFLNAVNSPSIAMLTGLILRASERNTCSVIDGTTAAAAALIAQRMSTKASGWWLMAQLEDHTAHALACERLDCTPLLDLSMCDEPGIGAVLSMPIIRAALPR